MSHSPSSRAAEDPPTLFLRDADIASLADWPTAVEALAQAYAANVDAAMVPPRAMARAPGRWLRSLTAVSPVGAHMACKLIAASTAQRRASYLIALFDNAAALTALMDGNRITGIRTAATAVVALRLLAPERRLTVAMIGAGFEARGLLDAVLACLPVASVRVFSPTPARRERLAAAFHQAGEVDVTAVSTAEAAVRGADVVLCAARSRDETPVLHGQWLAPGATVVSLGSTLPEQREVDETTLARAACIVADMPEEVLHDTGDALAAVRAGVDVASRLVALGDVAAGKVKGRSSAQDIVVYKSVGSALQDIVIAEMLFESAKARGLGVVLPVGIAPVDK